MHYCKKLRDWLYGRILKVVIVGQWDNEWCGDFFASLYSIFLHFSIISILYNQKKKPNVFLKIHGTHGVCVYKN